MYCPKLWLLTTSCTFIALYFWGNLISWLSLPKSSTGIPGFIPEKIMQELNWFDIFLDHVARMLSVNLIEFSLTFIIFLVGSIVHVFVVKLPDYTYWRKSPIIQIPVYLLGFVIFVMFDGQPKDLMDMVFMTFFNWPMQPLLAILLTVTIWVLGQQLE